MNNTGPKILILAMVIATAIAGVMVFYPTIVAPPTNVPVENLHKASLESGIADFSESKSYEFNDSIYTTIVSKLRLYGTEHFLSAAESDNLTKALVQKYVPVFKALSYKRFQAAVWRETDHVAMLSRIAQLRTLKVDLGAANAVTGSYNSDLANIENIIQLYYKAKKAAEHTIFYSVDDANKKIQDAESFKTADYIRNCTALVDKLSAVRVNIGNSHYDKVSAKIEEMKDYRYMSEQEFGALVTAADNAITEYRNNRSEYGSSAKSADNLKKQASKYYTEAHAYYESLAKPVICITPFEWTSMTSPHSSYRAYQSYTNYHVANSTALMYFTIMGYESFTFYIRSNGEADHDYVMVGINNTPTINSNYATTKGTSNNGYAFYNYKAVHLNNLNKASTYTIYVVYRKDSTIDEGTDTGYVLIPYAN